jgi:Fungal protein kinase
MDLRILHRDISFSNLLLTCSESPSGSAQLATELLIDFDYAQQLQLNYDASDETVIGSWKSSLSVFNDLNTHASSESSGVFIPLSNVTASAESSGASGMIPSLSSCTSGSTGGGPQVPSIPDRNVVTSDARKTVPGNQRTVSLYFLRWVKITNVNSITREHHPSCLLRASSQQIQISLRKLVMTSSHFSISSYIFSVMSIARMVQEDPPSIFYRFHQGWTHAPSRHSNSALLLWILGRHEAICGRID